MSLSLVLTVDEVKAGFASVQGGDDSVVDNEKAKLFVTGMDKKVAESKTYPNMKHDLLNETCRKDVFKEIIKWIKKS